MRGRTVFEAESPLSGRVRVIDHGRERRLVVAGDILSIYPLDGDWAALQSEYWGQALAALDLPPRPSALLVGLGGGTQVHLLDARVRPRLITVVERDPVIMQVALEWFGLREAGPLECYCGDATEVARTLARTRRRFDFVMEDTAYAAPLAESRALVTALADLVAPSGTLVVNRHFRGDGEELAAMLVPLFARVTQRRVRREGENVLVCGERRRARNLGQLARSRL
jgi:hypothetical protein